MAPLIFLAAILIPHCGLALRNVKKARAGAGRVAFLHSFGSPHVSESPLTDVGGGCLPGHRVVLFKGNGWLQRDSEDFVTRGLGADFSHPKLQTLALWKNTDRNALKALWPCDNSDPWRSTRNDLFLHNPWDYTARLQTLGSSYARLHTAALHGVLNSNESDVAQMKTNLAGSGWNLAGSVTVGEDVTHLLQERTSLRCLVTFEGSDSDSDWENNGKTDKVDFCGLPQRVHEGFRIELMTMVTSPQYQTNIRAKFGKCSSVDATGFSLGAAQATLFTACINNQIPSPDYNDMSWELGTAELMDEV